MEIHPSKRQKSFFNSAFAVSELSDFQKYHLGAILVEGHRIVSSGCNSKKKTHPLQSKLNIKRFNADSPGYIHAETDCLLPLLRQNHDFTNSCIYVGRKHADGSLALAKPCPGCMSLLKASGVKWCFYTTEDGFAKEKL